MAGCTGCARHAPFALTVALVCHSGLLSEQMGIACGRFAQRAPLLATMVERGITPITSADELGQIGFRLVSFPGGTARAVAHALQRYFGSLSQHRTTEPQRERMLDFDQLNALIGTPELLAQGRRYDGGEPLRPHRVSPAGNRPTARAI